MEKSDYKLWIDYHLGKINRELTPKETSEIRASEFAMHLLIPTDELLEVCGGIDNLINCDIYHNNSIVKKLAKKFRVEPEVMFFKLDYLIQEGVRRQYNENIKKKDVKIKVLKTESNIIYVKFN